MTEDIDPSDAETEEEIAVLDRRLAMLSLKRSWLQKRQAAVAADDMEGIKHVSQLLVVIDRIEFDADGQPFVKMDKIPDKIHNSLRDASFQQLINTSLQEAIGKSVDFSKI